MVEKNVKKQKAKAHRCQLTLGMNTGTRTHKSAKDYKRKKDWRNWENVY